MVKSARSGRTTLIGTGGREISSARYSAAVAIAMALSLGLPLAPASLGPLGIPVGVAFALVVAAFMAPSTTRRAIDQQAEQWPVQGEQIAFERAVYAKDAASAAYEPAPETMASELKKCRQALIAVGGGVVLVALVYVFLGRDTGTPLSRLLTLIWMTVALGYALIHIVNRILALRSLRVTTLNS